MSTAIIPSTDGNGKLKYMYNGRVIIESCVWLKANKNKGGYL
jgi:hypothetical protein